MSTLPENEIRLFSNQHVQQQLFKIIELPPELLAAFESASPPSLTIASAPDTAPSRYRGLKPRTALVTHGSTKYSMRSKNTSNPILLLQPSQCDPDVPEQLLSQKLIPSVTAIAQCEETIELIPLDERPEVEDKKINKWHEKFAKSREKK
ncbi:hypothetical protein K3495_g5500 [Podosphaera aphanis]|nr:hypothetical protein K3495_g5500 [Podosphaera aphanis]